MPPLLTPSPNFVHWDHFLNYRIKNCSHLHAGAGGICFGEDRKNRTWNGQMMMPLHSHLSKGSSSPWGITTSQLRWTEDYLLHLFLPKRVARYPPCRKESNTRISIITTKHQPGASRSTGVTHSWRQVHLHGRVRGSRLPQLDLTYGEHLFFFDHTASKYPYFGGSPLMADPPTMESREVLLCIEHPVW